MRSPALLFLLASTIASRGASAAPADVWQFPVTPWKRVGFAFGDPWHFGSCPAGTLKLHTGIDVEAAAGLPIVAAANGTIVADIPWGGFWGRAILVESWDSCLQAYVTAQYGHVTLLPGYGVGRVLSRGERFGVAHDMGTNSHLHFSVFRARYSSPAADPGALPRASCGGYPAFPSSFTEPTAFVRSRQTPCVTCNASVPPARWRGRYFTNPNLGGNPAMVRDDGAGFIDFTWVGSPSSACGVPPDGFSASWNRTVTLSTGTYEFVVIADDGVRLRVDGVLVLDKWFDQLPTTYVVRVPLTGGNHLLNLEHYDRTGSARAALSWQAVNVAPSVVAIARTGTGTGKTEWHDLPPTPPPYRTYGIETATLFDSTGNDGSWAFVVADWNRDGIRDLLGIKKAFTGSGSTEIHVASGPNFDSWLVNAGTALAETGVDHSYAFAVGDYNRDGIVDLFVVKKINTTTGSTEVHVLDGASGMRSWLVNTGTPLHLTGSDTAYDFDVADFDRDGILDLFIFKREGAPTTEVHILSGASTFTSWLHNGATILEPTGHDGAWMLRTGEYNGDGRPDVFVIKKTATASGWTEVHVLDGATAFGTWLLNTATPVPLGDSSYGVVYCVR